MKYNNILRSIRKYAKDAGIHIKLTQIDDDEFFLQYMVLEKKIRSEKPKIYKEIVYLVITESFDSLMTLGARIIKMRKWNWPFPSIEETLV